jgi:protein TonB
LENSGNGQLSVSGSRQGTKLEGDSREEDAMFNELPLSGPERRPTQTRWTFLLSLGGELTVLAVLLLIPLVYVQHLPFGWHETIIFPPPPPSAPPNVARVTTVAPIRSGTVLTVPTFIPPHPVIVHESFGSSSAPGSGNLSIPGTIPGTGNNERWTSILPSMGPAPPPATPAGPSRVKLGGDVEAARIIRMVRPIYPPIARQARIEGTVVLSAIIGEDGRVEMLHYVSGPPLLVQAALDAVRQWRYAPTLLNGRPVSVETTITVVFTLGDSGGGPGGPRAGSTTTSARVLSTPYGPGVIRLSPRSTQTLVALRVPE